jgi:hypothetical protein
MFKMIKRLFCAHDYAAPEWTAPYHLAKTCVRCGNRRNGHVIIRRA